MMSQWDDICAELGLDADETAQQIQDDLKQAFDDVYKAGESDTTPPEKRESLMYKDKVISRKRNKLQQIKDAGCELPE